LPRHIHGLRSRWLVAVAAAASLAALASLGGVGFAQSGIGLAQYQYGKKITICHKPGTPAEHTIKISFNAWPAHLRHHDVQGPCAATHARAEKADKKADKGKNKSAKKGTRKGISSTTTAPTTATTAVPAAESDHDKGGNGNDNGHGRGNGQGQGKGKK
jgi:hypothetical protein